MKRRQRRTRLQHGPGRPRFIEVEHRCISDGRARKRDEGNEAREGKSTRVPRRGGIDHSASTPLTALPLLKAKEVPQDV